MKTLWIIGGIPGSGKTTLAERLAHEFNSDNGPAPHFEADMFFHVGGEYRFNPQQLPQAHAWCRNNVEQAMVSDCDNIIVSNTFSQQWEIEPYRLLASKYRYTIFKVICMNEFANVHNVSPEVVAKVKGRFEY